MCVCVCVCVQREREAIKYKPYKPSISLVKSLKLAHKIVYYDEIVLYDSFFDKIV